MPTSSYSVYKRMNKFIRRMRWQNPSRNDVVLLRVRTKRYEGFLVIIPHTQWAPLKRSGVSAETLNAAARTTLNDQLDCLDIGTVNTRDWRWMTFFFSLCWSIKCQAQQMKKKFWSHLLVQSTNLDFCATAVDVEQQQQTTINAE